MAIATESFDDFHKFFPFNYTTDSFYDISTE